MEVVEHGDALLELLVEIREGAIVEIFTGGIVEFEHHGYQTLRF